MFSHLQEGKASSRVTATWEARTLDVPPHSLLLPPALFADHNVLCHRTFLVLSLAPFFLGLLALKPTRESELRGLEDDYCSSQRQIPRKERNKLVVWSKKYWRKSTKLFTCLAGYCREGGNNLLSLAAEKRTGCNGHKLLRRRRDFRETIRDEFLSQGQLTTEMDPLRRLLHLKQVLRTARIPCSHCIPFAVPCRTAGWMILVNFLAQAASQTETYLKHWAC